MTHSAYMQAYNALFRGGLLTKCAFYYILQTFLDLYAL